MTVAERISLSGIGDGTNVLRNHPTVVAQVHVHNTSDADRCVFTLHDNDVEGDDAQVDTSNHPLPISLSPGESRSEDDLGLYFTKGLGIDVVEGGDALVGTVWVE